MRVLVTGASGFVGNHLITELINRNHDVFAGSFASLTNSRLDITHIPLNIENADDIKDALLVSKPDAIIHLAAQSNVPLAWEQPIDTLRTNILGTVNLITIANKFAPNSKIISVGSSEEYGGSAKFYELLDEQKECLPQNPYAISKLSSGQMALQLANKFDMKVIHIRPFNHFGPGQRKGFVISDFASQIAEIEREIIEPKLYVGDLNTFRDFTDVRDIVNAYVSLIESDLINGIYNISSGKARKISDILDQLLKMSDKTIDIVKDPVKYRPAEVLRFAGDSSKIKNAIGWSVKHNFEESLEDTLEWWRSQVTLT